MGVFANVVIEIAVILMPLFVIKRGVEDTNFDKEKKKRVIIKPSKVTHVGIYIGDGKFIHASSGQKKVVINELDSKYYSERYYGAKRYR